MVLKRQHGEIYLFLPTPMSILLLLISKIL